MATGTTVNTLFNTPLPKSKPTTINNTPQCVCPQALETINTSPIINPSFTAGSLEGKELKPTPEASGIYSSAVFHKPPSFNTPFSNSWQVTMQSTAQTPSLSIPSTIQVPTSTWTPLPWIATPTPSTSNSISGFTPQVLNLSFVGFYFFLAFLLGFS
jgi:hypothetical protein